ncbi:MAG TPA: GDSL-type esterase/lipase family protein [Pyrinomonadaceae bacterium]|jgi:lysophospholipase L1-like esterase
MIKKTVGILSLLFIVFAAVYAQRLRFSAHRTGVQPVSSSSSSVFGFSWSMRPRFGAKNSSGLVEYHWNPTTQKYDDSYISPGSWTVDFDGCSSVSSQSALKWEIDGQAIPETQCRFSRPFSELKTYVVKLTAAAPGGQTESAEASVVLKDYFIVSIGDSFASGEGNPDKPRQGIGQEKWVDKRCHRSAVAGPAQAAVILENADAHSSVTFISFACSGAELNAGLTGGQEKGGLMLQPQLDKVFEAARSRPIDALLVSIGGNDVNFAKLVLDAIKLRHAETDKGANKLVSDGLASLPGRFALMSQRLSNPTNPTTVANVFITEYPDIVRAETRNFCDHSPHFPDLLNGISAAESEWALNKILLPLNDAVSVAAGLSGWNFVTGIADKFAGASSDHIAHGFCADDQRWARTFNDSFKVQGDPKGTVHPNAAGHAWYAQRLAAALKEKGIGASE